MPIGCDCVIIQRETVRALTHVYVPRALAVKRAAGVELRSARVETVRMLRIMRVAEQVHPGVRPYGVIVAHTSRMGPRA